MKDIYEKIKKIAEEVSELQGTVSKDNMSIIIGIADCTTQRATMCCSGATEGVWAMIRDIVYQIYGDDDDETERVNGNFS